MSARDNPSSGDKEWPSDAIMIVAAEFGLEVNQVDHLASVTVHCRSCNAKLAASPDTILKSSLMSAKKFKKKPVDFFCTKCAIDHKIENLPTIIDDRPKENNERN